MDCTWILSQQTLPSLELLFVQVFVLATEMKLGHDAQVPNPTPLCAVSLHTPMLLS